ncbi:peptide/nickel transport system substrate-binding protein [Pseudochelatococcus lubricantis]|uniref:Peptide/nickel transport system substrate-binding protein n=1 Tax=Pseudochelatococcus lubricantis TaxID=1538102 RepID=A0ABX0V1D5_9HYPH|nr:ABC transporter substrate-binding protein [Pseudochelatococcus lubricantis]NIJ57924.1 peptide/nickel transport system substrate-binding protein [Pseudochelatococcus lubricantis]
MTFINRRQALQGLALTGAAAALPFPRALAQGQDPRPELRIAVQGLAPTLEPVNAISNVGNRVTNALFDTLIRRDFFSNDSGSGTELVPAIAKSWKREDERTVVVSIADNVRFHNGDAVSAADVAYSLSAERLWGDKPLVPRGPLFSAAFESVEAIDGRTVRFRTKAPDFSLEKRLASWIAWVVPEKLYRALGPEQFGLKPVGTGPYKLVEFHPGDRVVLEAFDDYYLGKPTARRITFQVVPEVATRAAGLISGEYDIACALTPDNLVQLEGQPDVEARSSVIENVHLLVYQGDARWLSDKRIRQALNLAIDRKLIVDALWAGKAVIPNGFQIPAYGADFDPGRPPFRYDPEKARALVKEAGYDGEPISYRTLNDYYVNSVAAAQMMQEMWKAIGLNVRLDILENWGQVLAPGMQIRNWSNGFQFPDASIPLTSDWGPNGSPQQTHGWKASAEYNALAAKVRSLAPGEERHKLFQQLADLWEEEAPGAVLYRPVEIYGVRKTIGWKPVSFEFMDLRPYNLRFA